MFRRVVVATCLVASLGRGESVRNPATCPGSCDHPIAYTIDARFRKDERRTIEQAMRVWQDGTGGRVCFVRGGRDLVIEKVDRSEQLRPWDPDWARHVALTKGGRIWIVASRIQDPGEYRALVVHELGHHLGIGHIEDASATYMHAMIGDTPLELRRRARLPERDARAFCEVVRCTCSI